MSLLTLPSSLLQASLHLLSCRKACICSRAQRVLLVCTGVDLHVDTSHSLYIGATKAGSVSTAAEVGTEHPKRSQGVNLLLQYLCLFT